VNIADENPEKLEAYLPLAIAHLLKNGKSSVKNSIFWSKENCKLAVSRFAQTIS